MNIPTNINSHFLIRGVEVCVFLGWPDNERLEAQTVLLDIEIQFPAPPKACITDDLDDTICYAELITDIHDQLATRVFRLLEHLGYEIYQMIKPRLQDQARLSISLTKHPKIRGLTGGVCFTYRDEN